MATKLPNITHRSQSLTDAVRRFIVSTRQGPQEFDDLALRVVRLQAEALPGYFRLFQHRGIDPQRLQTWQEAPPVPTAAFKQQALTVLPAERIFRSSGTTEGADRRSEHHHANLDLYRLIVAKTLPSALLGSSSKDTPRVSILSMVAPLELVSDSSLGFMVDWAMTHCGNRHSAYAFGPDGNLDLDLALSWLQQTEVRSRQTVAEERPLILATGLALWNLLEAMEAAGSQPIWPPSTVVMETGGFKTRRFDLSRERMLERFEALTGLLPTQIVREYGMTELTSQAYASTLYGKSSEWFSVPPWVRVRALEPTSMQEAQPGSPGLLSFLDLGNVASATSILTEDLGVAQTDGRSFQLLGRAPDAELRGCSLDTEALLP